MTFTIFSNIVAGQLRSSAKLHRGINPSTKEELWAVPVASEEDVNDAVEAAQNALKSWSTSSWKSRQQLLLDSRQLLLDNGEDMAELLTKEGGKPVSFLLSNLQMTNLIIAQIEFARLEVQDAAKYLQFNGSNNRLFRSPSRGASN